MVGTVSDVYISFAELSPGQNKTRKKTKQTTEHSRQVGRQQREALLVSPPPHFGAGHVTLGVDPEKDGGAVRSAEPGRK